MKKVTILGATGSIGDSTLKVIRQHGSQYQVYALSAGSDIEKLKTLVSEFKPAHVAIANAAKAQEFATWLKAHAQGTQLHVAAEGIESLARLPEADLVVSAIVGAAGLLPTLAAIEAGKTLMLANKESLVMAGELMINAAKANNVQILPVDSEHNAIFQCLSQKALEQGVDAAGVEKIILTASGGPFINTSIEALEKVTPAEACKHPNWSMGRKISVDSATMMNKGLEVIEAYWLFSPKVEQIEVVIHPQSIVHSMVGYTDGSVLAQLGMPDMVTPIANCIGWPERLSIDVPRLDFSQMLSLDFIPPDFKKYVNLRLAFDALKQKGIMPAVLNAANEIAVERFLDLAIKFTDIPKINEAVMQKISNRAVNCLDDVLKADQEARILAADIANQLQAGV